MPSLDHLYVLVVDDNADARDIMKLGLEHEGAMVHVASNAPEGILMLSTVLPDVIVTDMTMPAMDGYEFLAHLKSSPAWRHIPVIAVTGFGLIHEERNARAAGFADYLLKPVAPTELAAAIVGVITRLKAR